MSLSWHFNSSDLLFHSPRHWNWRWHTKVKTQYWQLLVSDTCQNVIRNPWKERRCQKHITTGFLFGFHFHTPWFASHRNGILWKQCGSYMPTLLVLQKIKSGSSPEDMLRHALKGWVPPYSARVGLAEAAEPAEVWPDQYPDSAPCTCCSHSLSMGSPTQLLSLSLLTYYAHLLLASLF